MLQLSVLTYNIHKAIGVDRKFAPQRVVGILGHHDADVVLLQEVDRGVPRSDHIDLAAYLQKQLKYGHRAVGMNVFLKKGQYGNVTLSRHPIGRQRNVDLTIPPRKRRGAQHTLIHVQAGSRSVDLDVFNVHLSLTSRLRGRQVERLIHCRDLARLSARTPCIVGGDMNDWSGVLKRRFFEPAGFRCATNRRPGSRWAIKTFPSFAPTGGLDKVFYRGSLRPLRAHRSRLKLARVASDHLPVVCEFDVL